MNWDSKRTPDARRNAVAELRAGRAMKCDMPHLIFSGSEMKGQAEEIPEIVLKATELIIMKRDYNWMDNQPYGVDAVLAIVDLADYCK